MAVEQKSLYFYDDATPKNYRQHAVRNAGTNRFHLFFGPGLFGGAINQVNPSRLRVTGKGFAGGQSVRWHFEFSKDAVVNENTRIVTGGTWESLKVDTGVIALADLPSDDDDDPSIVDVPMPYFEDLEGAKAIRLNVVSLGTFTAGDFDAYVGITPNPVRNAGHDTVLRPGYATQPNFENFNTGRIN